MAGIAIPFLLIGVIQAFGSPVLFVLGMFATLAIILSFYRMPWAVSIEVFTVLFASMAAIGLFGYMLVQLLVVFMFAVMGFGFTKIFADLIFG